MGLPKIKFVSGEDKKKNEKPTEIVIIMGKEKAKLKDEKNKDFERTYKEQIETIRKAKEDIRKENELRKLRYEESIKAGKKNPVNRIDVLILGIEAIISGIVLMFGSPFIGIVFFLLPIVGVMMCYCALSGGDFIYSLFGRKFSIFERILIYLGLIPILAFFILMVVYLPHIFQLECLWTRCM